MSSPADATLDARLLHELKLLQHSLGAAPSADSDLLPGEGVPLLAVARLVHGIAYGQWEKLRNSMHLHGWCALEVCSLRSRLCAPHLADCEHCDDPLTGALLAAPLLHQLRREAARARRGQSPLALAVFRLHSEEAEGMRMLTEHVRHHMLDCDSLGLLDAHRLVLVLPGAGLFKAQALLEEILEAPSLPRCTVGIAGGQPDGDGSILLQQATQALQEAKEQGCAVRVYRQACDPLSERKTLVRSDEKRFLFSGGDI